MTLKRKMFFSNLLMLIIPVASVAIVVNLLTQIFTHRLFPDFLEENMENGYEPDVFETLMTDYVGEFVTLLILYSMAVLFIVIAVSLILTNKVLKNITVPIENLYNGAQRIHAGNFDVEVPHTSTEELNLVCNSFNEMQKQLKLNIQKQAIYEKDRSEMLAGISHDLRTPLTTIRSYVKGVQDGVAQTPEKEKEYLNIVYRNACEMEVLLDQLFLFSKLETGNLPISLKPINIQKYMITVLDSLEYILQKNNSKLILDSGCELEKVLCDSEQMKRVIKNILENSVKYNPDKPLHVTVTILKEGKNVLLRIKDDGIGVPNSQLPKLFDSFYRGDESRGNIIEGSGLGLSIAKKIIELHGGKIYAENFNGLAIVIMLPIVKEELR